MVYDNKNSTRLKVLSPLAAWSGTQSRVRPGRGEPHVSVYAESTERASVQIDASMDGTNWTVVRSGAFHGSHDMIVYTPHPFYRVVVTDLSNSENTISVRTTFDRRDERVNQPDEALEESDAPSVSIPWFMMARGRIPHTNGPTLPCVAGESLTIDRTRSTASTVRVRSGGSSSDTSPSGSGARTLNVVGVNASGAVVNATLSLAGESASDPSSVEFAFVNGATVATSGDDSIRRPNVGAIVIEYTDDNGAAAYVASADGASSHGAFRVPAGSDLYITRVSVSSGSGVPANVVNVIIRVDGIVGDRFAMSAGGSDRETTIRARSGSTVTVHLESGIVSDVVTFIDVSMKGYTIL